MMMKIDQKTDLKVIVLCLALSMLIFIFDSLLPLGVAGGVPYILIVLVSLWSESKKLPVYMALLVSALTILGFFTSPTGGELWKILMNRFLALFAIWTTAVLSNQWKSTIIEKEKVVSELKVLSGLLPICASCKKIRDDKGYWSQIESYIKANSEAEFSHGICPECAKELYPDFIVPKDRTGHSKQQ